MKTFKDANGTDWALAVNVGSVKRARELAGVDLMKLLDDKEAIIGKLIDDPEVLVNTLYALCKPEADAKGITDEQFGAAMVGEAIDRASTALMEDIPNFFPKGRREILTAVTKKVLAATAAMEARATAKVDAIDVGLLLQKLGGSSGASPDSSASTPAP